MNSAERLGGGEQLNESKWDMKEVPEFKIGNKAKETEPEHQTPKTEKSEEIEAVRSEIAQKYKEIKREPVINTEGDAPAIDTQKKEKDILGATVKVARSVGRSVLVAGACAGAVMMPPLGLALIPFAILEAGAIQHDWRGVNGSIFEVDNKNKITQTINPIPALIKYRGKTSLEIFQIEIEKLFDGLEKGETYHTRSHAVTYAMLQRAQKKGKVHNLQQEPAGMSRLLLENLATGNFKEIFKGKKRDMYNISFEVV